MARAQVFPASCDRAMLIIGYGIGLVAVFEYLWELPWIPKPSGVLWMAFCLMVSLRFFRRTWQ